MNALVRYLGIIFIFIGVILLIIAVLKESINNGLLLTSGIFIIGGLFAYAIINKYLN